MALTRAEDREALAVAGSVVTLTPSKILASTRYAKCQVQTAPVRVTVDGTDPVGGSLGDLYNVGDIFEVWGQDMNTIKFIKDGSTSAVVEVDYQGGGA